MEFSYLGLEEKRKKADALVLPFWKDKQTVHPAASFTKIRPVLRHVIETRDFKAKEGEVVYLYIKGLPETRLVLLGLGSSEMATTESLRRAYGSLTKSCLNKKLRSLNLFIPTHASLDDKDLLTGIIEGLLLPNYLFHELKHKEPDESDDILLQKATWIGEQKQVIELSEKFHVICQAVYFARDLINGNADKVTPQYLSQCAVEFSKKHPAIHTKILDKKQIVKEKLGLLLAVNRGSALDPAFIIMKYHGNPDSNDRTVIVGKGVTYDTGGLNLKPVLGSMEHMKSDMAGAAACFGIILAASRLKLRHNLTVAIPATENCIDAKSYKPGDVYTSCSGKTVELTNADAEGRLILADALTYALKKLQPTRIIDLATLTGAIEIALGTEAAGLMSTNDDLAQSLIQSGEATHERLWRMPLFDEYKERLKSDFADLKNWHGRGAGANVAATFLRLFVGETIPWAHLDIAGTAFLADGKKYLPKYATGFGIRLIIDFLEKLQPTLQSKKQK